MRFSTRDAYVLPVHYVCIPVVQTSRASSDQETGDPGRLDAYASACTLVHVCMCWRTREYAFFVPLTEERPPARGRATSELLSRRNRSVHHQTRIPLAVAAAYLRDRNDRSPIRFRRVGSVNQGVRATRSIRRLDNGIPRFADCLRGI